MKVDDFRRIALSMPGASESAHMGHPDFRVGGKIFATLGYTSEESGVIMLPPDEQERLVRAYPAIFMPIKGAWGRQGSTQVNLEAVDAATLRSAMVAAWRKKAPAGLVATGR
jgi:hypothetical protein